MIVLRLGLLASVAVAFLVGASTDAQPPGSRAANEGQSADRPADQQAKELIEKYRKFPVKDQAGPEGERVVEQLRGISGRVSSNSQEAIARLQVDHYLRKLSLAIHDNQGKAGERPAGQTPAVFEHLLPFIESRNVLRPVWEYKVVTEADIQGLGKEDLASGLNKLGEDGWELTAYEKARFIFKRQK